jgi:hypothetical protein
MNIFKRIWNWLCDIDGEIWAMIGFGSLVIGAVVAVILVVVYVDLSGPKTKDVFNPGSIKQEKFNGYIERSCIEGHQYYFWRSGGGESRIGGMAPVLTDDGKPVMCVMEEK